jgi:hypothetical protein
LGGYSTVPSRGHCGNRLYAYLLPASPRTKLIPRQGKDWLPTSKCLCRIFFFVLRLDTKRTCVDCKGFAPESMAR